MESNNGSKPAVEDDYDDYFEDDDNDGEPDYWECLCCNYSCIKRPAFGGQCPKCSARMEEGYF